MKMGDPELISRAYGLLSNDSDKRRNDAYGYYANLLLEENAAITEKALKSCLIAVNGKQATPQAKLRDGDTVYLFPAAAGG